MTFWQDFQGKVLKYNTHTEFNCNQPFTLFMSFSSSLPQFQPIFVSFVAIFKAVLSRCFKGMSLSVGILPLWIVLYNI